MNDWITAVETSTEFGTTLPARESLEPAQNNKFLSRTCVIVGSGTLAIYCAEYIQAAGHLIKGVLATDDALQVWAARENIPCIDSVQALKTCVKEQPVDWLFSIVNPIILPTSLIEHVHEGAFNYHDGPLPHYAGSHATSWALLAHEAHHAISWHCIATTVDAGDIAIQRAISINEDDTALTLNLKCYQAAREGFVELLMALSQGSLITHPQALDKRSFYAKFRRPLAGAYLCWTNTAQDLSSLACALDFGELYPNPLGCPKLLLKQGVVRATQIKRLNQRSGEAPGTVIHLGQDAWRVATGTEDVLISGFSSLEGEPLSAQVLAAQFRLQQGERLPTLSKKQAQSITELYEALAPSESFWHERLVRLQPVLLPFERGESDSESDWVASAWCSPLIKKGDTNASLAELVSALGIYIARLTGQTQFQIGWQLNNAKDPFKKFTSLASVVPMEIAVDLDQPFAVTLHNIEAEFAKLKEHRTFVRDLIARYPTLRDLPILRTARPWRLTISVLTDEARTQPVSEDTVSGALLTLQVNTRGEFRWLYDAKRLDAAQVQRMGEHLRELFYASAGIEGAEISAGKLNLLTPNERELLLQTWNKTQSAYPVHLCVHQLFEAQVERMPDAVALAYKEQTLSYAELNARANGLAHRLIKLGVKPDARVAICVQRSPAMVVGLLAILKAGGAYVPLDPAYPSERLAYILNDAAPAFLLADSVGRAALDESILSSLIVLDPDTPSKEVAANPHVPELTSHHLAYVIYTSGSTGAPKGVMVVHRGVSNYLNWAIQAYAPKRGAVVSSSLSFDATVTSLWTPLLYGSTVLLLSEGKEVDELEAYVRQAQGEGLVKITPAHLEMLGQRLQANGVRTRADIFVIGGEAINPATAALWQRIQPDLRLINEYGPTETVVGCVIYEMDHLLAQSTSIPIGRPIANTRLYLLDAYGQPVPLGAIGELYIGGAGVARGYLNRPELTAERFLTDPFSDEADARMYKTGDLARYLPDGNLEYLGRNDDQIKIRGFRIELGEIEARLLAHPLVREAVVIALGEASDKRLVAYVVAEPDEELAHLLRTHVAAGLPEYMVPAAFVRLDAFPLTPNGKLDRRALPAPNGDAFARQAYAAPEGELEMTLAALWSDLLGIKRIGRHDSFFALGGHSLLAVQMIERLRRLGLTVSVRALFDTHTLSVLAQSLGQHREVAVPPNLITPNTHALTPELLPLIDLNQSDIDRLVERVPGGVSNIQDIYALSPLQDGILFHHLLATEGDPYLVITQMAFADRQCLDCYLEAVQQVVNRHDILRTAFIWEDLSTPAQVVLRQASFSITELKLDPADGLIVEQLSQRFDPCQYRLDLTQAPLLRFVVARDGERWILLELQHHLIGDHSTLEVMRSEIRAFIEGQGDTLLPAQPFRNLIAQTRLGLSSAEHERFFTEMLAEVEEPTLPFGLADVRHGSAQITESHRELPQALNDRLRAQARRLEVSLASICHLAWAQVLTRASGQQRVVFGTVLLGRMQAGDGADCAMGLFINTLPLCLELGNSGVEDRVRYTHARLAGLLEHEHASLALAQRCSGITVGAPLFSALLNYRHNLVPLSEQKMMPGIEFLSFEERTNYPLTLSIEDGGNALGLTAQVVQPLEAARVCGYMQKALESLLEALEHAPEMPVQQLEVMPDEEHTLLLKTWNATAAPYPAHQCIHQLFEAQVERTPNAIALIYEEETLSYAELNARANGLAYRLIKLGVKPDARVAICVQRSPAMVIGLLAILKAGGAYVPLDAEYPSARLAHILTETAPTILLADAAGCAALGEAPLAALTILDPTQRLELTLANPHIAELTPHHLAYVIYTSGSTGMPKGIMVEHAQIVHLFDMAKAEEIEREYPVSPNHSIWMQQAYDLLPTDRVLQKAPLSFDVSVWELFCTLLNGASLVLAAPGVHKDSSALMDLMIRQRITTAHFVPSMLSTFLHSGATQVCDSMRRLICTGEALTAANTRLCKTLFPHAKLHNLYGPTEATIGVTAWTCPTEYTEENVSIGRPIANTRIYLLNECYEPVLLGAAGEVYVGGANIVRGYLHRPDLTAERFLPDPFSDHEGARMYKTNDLARYRPDGNLEFLGRNDHQVKIRGLRIELDEIRACLVEHPYVQDATALVLGEGSDEQLVAYIAAEPNEALALTLRAYLTAKLPAYMVPAAFVRLDQLPLTANGKLDRRALPAVNAQAFAHQIYEAPQGEIETALAEIWCELLGVHRVSRHDDFFALGGHSLLAVRLVNRMAPLGAELPLATLFNSPSLASLAAALNERLSEKSNTLAAIMPIPREGALPLSFAQQRLWFLAQFEDMSASYHIPLALHLSGNLKVAAWQQALDTLFARHEVLRSVFVESDGEPQLQLLAADLGLPMCWHDLRSVPDAKAQLERLMNEEAHALFDLEKGPLIRARLIQLADDEHVFLLTQHHIIFDGWSFGVLRSELNTLYTAYCAGQTNPLPPLTVQYVDYAAWQQQWLSSEQLQIQSAYWRKTLADPPILLTLPTDRPRPPTQSFAGAQAPICFDAQITQALKRLSQESGVTLFTTIAAAWGAVLAELSAQDDLIIGTPSANRNRREIEPLIGFFVNMLALRLDLSGKPNTAELLERVRESVLAAQIHQDLPFEEVAKIVQPPRRLDHTPIFQVMFAWQSFEMGDWCLPGLKTTLITQSNEPIRFDLELILREQEGEIVGNLRYAMALFDRQTIERHVSYLYEMLCLMALNERAESVKVSKSRG